MRKTGFAAVLFMSACGQSTPAPKPITPVDEAPVAEAAPHAEEDASAVTDAVSADPSECDDGGIARGDFVKRGRVAFAAVVQCENADGSVESIAVVADNGDEHRLPLGAGRWVSWGTAALSTGEDLMIVWSGEDGPHQAQLLSFAGGAAKVAATQQAEQVDLDGKHPPDTLVWTVTEGGQTRVVTVDLKSLAR